MMVLVLVQHFSVNLVVVINACNSKIGITLIPIVVVKVNKENQMKFITKKHLIIIPSQINLCISKS